MQKLGVSNSPTLGSKESTPNQIRTRHLPRDFYNRHVRQPSRVPEDSERRNGLCDMYDRIIPEDAGYTDAMREAADMDSLNEKHLSKPSAAAGRVRHHKGV